MLAVDRRLPWTLVLALVAGGWPATAVAQVTGTVLDSATSDPIECAIVTLQTTEIRAVTDAEGDFDLSEASGSDLVIVAAMKGYFHGAATVTSPASGVEILLDPVSQDENRDYPFSSPVLCGFCHETQYDEWDASPMGNTGLNLWVYDLYNGSGTSAGMNGFVYTEDSVLADTNPESECAACHQPVRWLREGEFVALGDIESPTAPMVQSVSCDICHKVANVDVEKIAWPGVLTEAVTVTRPEGAPALQVQYGVLGDVSYSEPFTMRPSYQPQLVAELCGICHEEKSDPDQDGNYDDAQSVHIQSTYSDWVASPYGDPASDQYRTCVGCHMPASEDDDVVLCSAVFPPLLRPGSQVHSHDIQGTSPEFLENALSMTLAAEVRGIELAVTVEIENDQAGHKVPSGIPLRHMILLVEANVSGGGDALDHTGDQVISDYAGVGSPLEGYYGGLAGKYYGKVLEDAEGNAPVFYTEATAIQFDTRVAPGETDATSYRFALPVDPGVIDVRARLIYRRAWRSLIDEKEWTETGLGSPLADIEPPHFGFLMEEAVVSVESPGIPQSDFARGDLDGNGQFLINDPIRLLDYMFNSKPTDCVDAGDIDDSGQLLLNDPILLLAYLFSGGDPPADPFPDCGPDPTADAGGSELGCLGPVPECR